MSKSRRSARPQENEQAAGGGDVQAAAAMSNSMMAEMMGASSPSQEASLLDELLAGAGSNAGLENGSFGTPASPPPSGATGGNVPAPPSGSAPALGIDPALSPDAPNVSRPPDGMTDYYMETHWDSGAFYQLADQHGLPGNLPDAVSRIDALLPADLSPDLRATIHIACSIGSGALDGYLKDQILSSLGTPGVVLGQLIGVGQGISDYVDLDDPLGATLFGGTVVLDAAIDALGAFCEDSSSKLATIESVAAALVQVPAVIAGVLGPEATAAVEAAAFAVGSAIEAPRILLRAAAALADDLQAALDVVLFLYNDARALQAQGHEQFEKAAQYKDLMRDNVLDGLVDHVRACANAILMLPLAGIAKTLVFTVPKWGMKGVDFALEKTTGVGLPSLEDLAQATKTIGGELSDTEGFNNLLDPIGAGDAMRVDPDSFMGSHFTEREGDVGGAGGGYTSILQAARTQTVDDMDRSYVDLKGDAPEWYQKLINQIAEDGELTFADATSPLYWIGELIEAIPGLADLVADTSAEGLARACESAAGFLSGDLQPVADVLTGAIAGYKPELDQILVEMNDMVQEQDVQLDRLTDIIGNVDLGLVELEGMLGELDGFESSIDEVIGTLDGLRIDPTSIELPPMVPQSLVESLVQPINGQIDAIQTQLMQLAEQSIQGVKDTVQVGIDNLQGQLALFEAALSDGGSFKTALDEQVAEVKATIDMAVTVFTEWDGVLTFDLSGASDTLMGMAEACRTYAENEEQIEDPWSIILATVARPGVDDWRARHEDDVEAQYNPKVPAAEVAACREIYEQAKASAEAQGDVRGLVALQDAYEAAASYSGQQGRSELYGFWAAGSTLLKVANRIG